MKKTLTRLAGFLLLVAAGSAATPQGMPDPPVVSVKIVTSKVAPGATVKGTVVVMIGAGFHAYQNPPSHDYEIPLKIESDSKGIVLKPKYPAGVMIDFAGSQTAAYEGKVEIPFTFTAPKKLGSGSVKVKVSYQLCNDSNCWPPGAVSGVAKFTVAKPAKAK